MKSSRLLSALLLSALPIFAVERIADPVSPSLWDAFLPESVHPSYASDLGSLQEGRLGFGIQGGDLAHFSLSVPGLQIISANTRWVVDNEETRLTYDPERADLATGGEIPGNNYPDRQRDLFRVSGGLRLSNFIPSLKDWDLGAGATFTNLAVTNEDEKKIWSQTRLGGSLTAQYGRVSLSGAWDSEEQRYRAGFRSPHDLQAGLEFYKSFQVDSAWGAQLGTEKVFRESIKLRAGMRWQWAGSERVENMMLFGTSIRFRPWRAGIDPTWLQPIVAPGEALPLLQRFLYDWEASIDMMSDNQYGGKNWLFSLTRWF